tara:strand:- start:906 stop:1304 length:399 start_codon:yes stop_codon:yes gene_type:complete
MLSYLYYILGYNDESNQVNNNIINEEDNYLDKELINIKSKLKKVNTIKKKFYTPSIIELNNQIYKIKNKNNKFIPKNNELIESKNNLKKTKYDKIIKKTFTDELKIAKLKLKKTSINYRIDNLYNKNYVVTI